VTPQPISIVPWMGRKRRQPSVFAKRLQQLRRERAITQVELAQRLDVTQGLISLYERGAAAPTTQMLTKLAEVLGTSTDDLVGLHQHKSKRPVETREDLRLMRRLWQVRDLPPKTRRTILRFIEVFVSTENRRSGTNG
jgi:transcriptional regulator with XRE-family HTH domain